MNRIYAESNEDANKYQNVQNQLSFASFFLHVIQSFLFMIYLIKNHDSFIN